MKILFLDIDGVLNSQKTAEAFGGYPLSFKEEDMLKFDMTALALVRKLCKETNTKVVVSSTWRKLFSVKELANNLKLPVIDITPRTKYNLTRGQEIKLWLEKNPGVTYYAIVDDNSDMLPQQKFFFVKTDHKEGLSLANYQSLFNILNTEEY